MDRDQQIVNAIWAAIYFGIALGLFAYLSHQEEDGGPTRWRRWLAWFQGRYITSPSEGKDYLENDIEDDVVAPTTPATTTDNRIATPNNVDNHVLTDNARWQGKVEALAALVQTGKVGQAEGVELVFGCSRSSRADSAYQRARTALLPLLKQSPPSPQFPPLTDEQRDLREMLGLEKRG